MSGQVYNLGSITQQLRAQGAVVDVAKARPVYLGLNGYVGLRVPYKDGRVERVWVRGVQMGEASAKAQAAEWLTLTLAGSGEELPVDDVIQEYLKQDIAPHWEPVMRVSVLSHVAGTMGFLYEPLATKLWLPHDHPMAERRIIVPSDLSSLGASLLGESGSTRPSPRISLP